jgi:hypothetical protein
MQHGGEAGWQERSMLRTFTGYFPDGCVDRSTIPGHVVLGRGGQPSRAFRVLPFQ